MAPPRLNLRHTAILVVDVQDKLVGHMHNAGALVDQVGRLLDGAAVLGLPLLVTEQYPPGLGRTVAELEPRLAGAACRQEKLKFSACVEAVRDTLVTRGVRSVLVCGIEAHVCVLQTCLDLIDGGYLPAVAVDAIGSRRKKDQDTAVMRMVQAGVVPTTVESALLEMVGEAGGSRFKSVLSVIK